MTPAAAGGAVLVLDAALEGCLAGVVRDGAVLAERRAEGLRASTSVLPAMGAEVLAMAGIGAAELTRIAVTVGPGSFTGVRAALALAHGIGLAAGVEVVGVTLGDAIRAALSGEWPVWVAIDSKRNRVFLDRDGEVETIALEVLPLPGSGVAVAGNAAVAVVSRLAARGAPVRLLAPRRADAAGIAAAAEQGGRAALPLYVDRVAARANVTRRAPGGDA